MLRNSSSQNTPVSLGLRVSLDLPGGWQLHIRPPLNSDQARSLVTALRQLQMQPWSGYYDHDFNPQFRAIIEDRSAA